MFHYDVVLYSCIVLCFIFVFVSKAEIFKMKGFTYTMEPKAGYQIREQVESGFSGDIGIFSEGYALFFKNGKAGYMNTNGEECILAQYQDGRLFSEGAAAVKKNDKWGFINQEGVEFIPLEYDFAESFVQGFAILKQDKNVGVIDHKGKMVLPLAYDNIGFFSEGLFLVQQGGNKELFPSNGKYGFANQEGEIVIPIIYEDASSFLNGLACVKYENGKYGYIDKTGTMVISAKFENANSFFQGVAYVTDENFEEHYIDTKGNIVLSRSSIEANEVDGYGDFSDEFISVREHSSGGQVCFEGYADWTGKIVIPCKYRNLSKFHNGIAVACNYNGCYLIDKTGKEVFGKDGNYYIDYAGENCYFVSKASEEELEERSYKKFYYMNAEGKQLTPAIYSEESTMLHEGYATVFILQNPKEEDIQKQVYKMGILKKLDSEE